MKSTKVQSHKKWQFEHWPPVKGRFLSVVCKSRQEKNAFLYQIQISDTVCAAAGENTF